MTAEIAQVQDWEAVAANLDIAIQQVELLTGRMVAMQQLWCRPEWMEEMREHLAIVQGHVIAAGACRHLMHDFEDVMRERRGQPTH